MDNTLYFHIGYHKTATTLLQKNFFSKNDSTALLNDFKNPWSDDLVSHLVKPSLRSFSKERFRQILMEKTKNNKAKKLVVSSERLSGQPSSGGFDNFIIADRIKSAFPNAKVIIGIRNQKSMILSMYKQLVHEGYRGSIESMLTENYWQIPSFSKEYLEYDLLLQKYFDLFGAENVLVLPYEQLRKQPEVYFSRLTNFLEIAPVDINEITSAQVNVSKNHSYLIIRRFLNHVRKTELNPTPIFDLKTKNINLLTRVVSKLTPFISDYSLSNDLKEEIEQYYQQSNKRLKILLPDLDLKDYLS
ncbi:sulfotransferase [Algivirga pacifica]|uniref:Sulfotransferase domain-containing protein n=1 Tax=Algivirga pacifica TaxID=1162670 RepID=A0ABP9D3B8_9BACT